MGQTDISKFSLDCPLVKLDQIEPLLSRPRHIHTHETHAHAKCLFVTRNWYVYKDPERVRGNRDERKRRTEEDR